MNKQVFQLAYTRDRQIITQSAWFYANSVGIEKMLHIKLPFQYPVVYYVRDGAVEIWENTQCIHFVQDKILYKNKSDPSFLKGILDDFKNVQEGYFYPIYRKKFLSSPADLREFAEQFKKYCVHFFYIWNTMLDSRTPKTLQEMANSWRGGDEYFDVGGGVLSETLVALYPTLEGYQNYILETEIEEPPTLETLTLRSKHFVYIPGSYGKNETLLGFQKEHQNMLFEEDLALSAGKEFSGQTAYGAPPIRGIVRIVRNLKQVPEVQDGEIVVSPMTIPEFLPAMKKALAIVTDEGGLLCHAAIVSRELKKPCIIGTKIATKVLKDGMLVEVDAERGVVTILQRGEDGKKRMKSEQMDEK